jgi:hypothetical protein
MPTFSIRVELPDADEADHAALDAAMAVHGIVKTAKFSGVLRRLPVGQYIHENPAATAASVCEKARVIAASVKRAPEILVAQSEVMISAGLPEAPARPIAPRASAASQPKPVGRLVGWR